MGERLVIEIKRENMDEKPICSLYYHWSAYTVSAIQECASIIQNCAIDNSMSDDEILHEVIGFAQKNYYNGYNCYPTKEELDETPLFMRPMLLSHGGVCQGDLQEAMKKWENEEGFLVLDNVSRNNGLVSFSEESMYLSEDCATMMATIFLESKTVFGSFINLFDMETFEEYGEVAEIISEDSVMRMLVNDEFEYDDIVHLATVLSKIYDDMPLFFQIEKDGDVYEVIK